MHLAIVIPTLDEERALESILSRALSLAEHVVVADGGSRDDTLDIARRAHVEVVSSAPGRGTQLNRGAEHAIAGGADALLFLHADTELPAAAPERIADALTGGAVGGAFCLRFDDPRLIFRLGSTLVNLRTRLFQIPLGDQAQFAAATAYRTVGGFPEWPILEDVEFVRRLRRLGKLVIIRDEVKTDVRRFRERGIVRTVVTNWLIWLLHSAGVPPQRLARLYRTVR